MEEYFYPKSISHVKYSKMENLKLIFEAFFPQAFFATSLIYSFIMLSLPDNNYWVGTLNQSISMIELYLIVTLPSIIILLYQKYGSITFPSIVNGIYLLLYLDYDFQMTFKIFIFSIEMRYIVFAVYGYLGYYMAYFRFNNFKDDAFVVYYIAYLSLLLKTIIEYFENDGLGVLIIFLIIFITMFMIFMFPLITIFVAGFLIGVRLYQKRFGKYNLNYLYPSADGGFDTLHIKSNEYKG